jgi:hypothetical protein
MRKMLEKTKNKRAVLALLLCCIILVCLSGCVAPPVEKAPTEEVPDEGVTPTPTPKTPEELIEISGSVTIADKVKAGLWEYTPEEAGNVIWIVDVTATNRNFEDTLTSNPFFWYLVIDEKVRHSSKSLVLGFSSPEFNLSIGETGETRSLFVMPATADAGNTKLAYQLPLRPYHFGDIEIIKRTDFIYISKSGGLVEEEPMEISGYVTITDKVKAGLWEYTPEEAGNVIWVVDVNVKNKYFEDDLTSNFLYWHLVTDGVKYTPKLVIGFSSPKFNLSLGESGSTRFVYVLPDGVSIGDAKLGYKEFMGPYFFGELEGGGKVESLVIEE